MAFSAVAPRSTMTRTTDNEPLTMGLHNGTSGYAVSFRLSAVLLKVLGWSIGDRVILLEGSGPDAGVLKIARSEKGYMLVVNGGKTPKGAQPDEVAAYFRVLTKALVHYTTPRETVGSAAVVYQTFGGELTLLAPDWLQPVGKAPTLEERRVAVPGLINGAETKRRPYTYAG
jgi:hypothetical protein